MMMWEGREGWSVCSGIWEMFEPACSAKPTTKRGETEIERETGSGPIGPVTSRRLLMTIKNLGAVFKVATALVKTQRTARGASGWWGRRMGAT